MNHQVHSGRSGRPAVQELRRQQLSSQESSTQSRQTRRSALRTLGAGSLAAMCWSSLAGCKQDGSSEAQPENKPQSVSEFPLNVLLVGTSDEADAISDAFALISEQPLKLQVVDPQQSVQAIERLTACDVAILPQSLLGAAAEQDLLVPRSDDWVSELNLKYGTPFQLPASALGRWGADVLGIAVGAKLPARLAADPESDCQTWQDYQQWVQTLGGKAAEALMPGWAGWSFLNRCASSVTGAWLFESSELAPALTNDEHVAVLQQLCESAASYDDHQLTPGQIATQIRQGKLLGGIGMLTADAASTDSEDAAAQARIELSVFDLPAGVAATKEDGPGDQSEAAFKPLLGPNVPLACLTTGCRQNEVATAFIGWLSSNQDTQAMHRRCQYLSVTRSNSPEEAGLQPLTQAPYERWLQTKLRLRSARVPMNLPGADDYYQALDQAVGKAIAGELSAAAAMNQAAQAWDAITESIGRDQQKRAWKMARGL